MNVAERVAELLAGVPIEEQIRGREIEDRVEKDVVVERGAAALLGFSGSQTYRLFADGRLGGVKLEGGARKGHGRAGSIRIRLIDIVRFQVENERTPGTPARKTKAAASPVRPIENEKAAVLPAAAIRSEKNARPERTPATFVSQAR